MNTKTGIIVLVLSLLAALEPLSIDLYLPAFTDIAESLRVSLGEVQISLSIFLAGFAVGQLFWGPLSDLYGRKRPILIAMFLFTISSFSAIFAFNIEQLWVIRFLQAFGGCAGVVIGRAAVNDLFDTEERRTRIFSLLVIISGIAPIIAPTLGNLLLKQWHWHGVFYSVGLLGILTMILVAWFLPSTGATPLPAQTFSAKEVIKGYIRVTKNWPYMAYSIIGCMAYGSLMIYVSNAPFLIMKKGMFSGDTFSIIFAINAIGLMIGTYAINYLQKFMTLRELVRYTVAVQLIINLLLFAAALYDAPVSLILVLIFLNLLPVGLLLPATTSLGLSWFTDDSGTASAFMGFLQLAFTCILSAVVSCLQNDSVLPMTGGMLFCAIVPFVLLSTHRGRAISVAGVKS